ncbi:MAG: hydrophobic/amphiphilic exporter (mainly bacteria), family, partial [Actinoplanes sp.]|nr:hydrophobic/amphiphilic exporter (mainly bacteria), family [Actinoplanes sp.]
MSRLARLSLANRGLVAILAMMITAFGLFLIPSLRQQLLPSLDFPAASIATPFAGAGPDIVDQQVSAPIVTAISGVDGIKTVSSTSSEGLSVVQAEFEFGTDLDKAVENLQAAVVAAQPSLPAGVSPKVGGGGTDDLPAVTLAASAGPGGDLRTLARRVQTSVIPDLKAIDGVRDVTLSGVSDEQVVISPDPAKLQQFRIDPGTIGPALQANGISMPAGAVTQQGKSLPVQVGTPITSLNQLRNIALQGPSGPTRLGDVALVEQKVVPATSLNRTNGLPSIAIGVTVTQAGNPVAVSTAIRDKLAELKKKSGATLVVTFDQAPFVQRSIKSLATEGLLGLVMAILIILLFLRSVRSTIVTALSIPLSLIIALISLKYLDYSLNLLTLGALTIAVGRVVDDSIVVLENIKRHLAYGGDKKEAVLTGVREVAGAVTSSTVVTAAVFLPIAFVTGLVGQLFAPFAVTVSVSLAASLIVSLTVIPVFAYWFLKAPKGDLSLDIARAREEQKELNSLLVRLYLPFVRFATKHRLTTVLAGILVLFFTFGLAGNVRTNFLDQDGQDTITVTQELPIGSSLSTLDGRVKQVEKILHSRTDLTSYDVSAGGRLGGNKAQYSLILKDHVDAALVKTDLEAAFKRRPALGEMAVAAGQSASSGDNGLSVLVKAPDAKTLDTAADQVAKAMAGAPDVKDVRSSLTGGGQRIEVRVDQTEAAQAGVTEQEIGQQVAAAFRGTPIGQVNVGGKQIPLMLSSGPPPSTVGQLRSLMVPASAGPVPLASLADVVNARGASEVDRVDGDRAATITGTATGTDIGATTKELTARLDALRLPQGASYQLGGVSADQSSAFTSLGLAVFTAIALVFLVMVATFRSLLQPLILLVSIPFAGIGAIGALLATDTALGVPSMIGLLMLVGIVVTNAIVFIDLVNHYRAEGMPVREAVIEGGRRRLRPILMTAFATIFALIPMALGLTGEGGFISKPLAVVVIGGLVSST